MVRLRLTRLGAKKKPFYRLVAADSRCPRDGKFIEQLGWYNPLLNPHTVKLDLSRIDYWLSVGAQPSDTAKSLIAKARAETADPVAA
jgi:small subunit ribosomal protein S16